MGSATGLSFHNSASAFVERADGTVNLPGVSLDLSGLDMNKVAEAIASGVAGALTFRIECIAPDGSIRWTDTAVVGPRSTES